MSRKPAHGPSDQLVKLARRIVTDCEDEHGSTDMHFAVANQIGLLLEQLDEARSLHAGVREAMLEDELQVKADLGRVERLFHGYPPQELTLTARLLSLEQERRRTIEQQHRLRWELYSELSKLVQRYQQLAPSG